MVTLSILAAISAAVFTFVICWPKAFGHKGAFGNNADCKQKYLNRLQRNFDGITLASHSRELGIPQVVLVIADEISREVASGRIGQWQAQFLSGIAPGADLSQVWPEFAAWLMDDPEDGLIRCAATMRQQTVMKDVAKFFRTGGLGTRTQSARHDRLWADVRANSREALSIYPHESDSNDALLAACAVTAAEPAGKCYCWAADAIHYAARVLVSRAVGEKATVPAAHTLLESEAANDDEKVVAAFAHLGAKLGQLVSSKQSPITLFFSKGFSGMVLFRLLMKATALLVIFGLSFLAYSHPEDPAPAALLVGGLAAFGLVAALHFIGRC